MCISAVDWHTLEKVKIGLAIPHDPHTYETVNWRVGQSNRFI
jgi:hypothetical protein